MKKTFICIICPKSCSIEIDQGQIISKLCKRGQTFALQEIKNPSRIITTAIWLKPKKNSKKERIPVKTKELIPLKQIPEVMQKIRKIVITEKQPLGTPVLDKQS